MVVGRTYENATPGCSTDMAWYMTSDAALVDPYKARVGHGIRAPSEDTSRMDGDFDVRVSRGSYAGSKIRKQTLQWALY